MSVTENEVVAWLRQLPNKRFFDVVYRGAEGRGPDPIERTFMESHVVAGIASRVLEDSGAWGPWGVELVGVPREGEWDDDAPICQSGSHCGCGVVSWAKQFRCPVCGGDATGT